MDRVQAFVDAQRLAYADRDHYFGDPDEVDIPLDALMNPAYLRERAKGDSPLTQHRPLATLRLSLSHPR